MASSWQQAHIGFEHALAFLEASGTPFADFRVQDHSGTASIEHRRTGTRLRAIASDPRRAHGLAPSLVLADEPAQWEPGTADRMYAALRTSAGKVPGCRIVALGTRPASRDHWFSRLLERDIPGVYRQSHAATPGAALDDREAWAAANPSLRAMPMLRQALELEAAAAAEDSTLVPAFEALRLNMGVADERENVLLDAKTWRRLEDRVDGAATMYGDGYVLGVDLGGAAAMSACAAYWPDGRLDVVAAFSGVPSLEARAQRDAVGDRYHRMLTEGTLLQLGYRVTDVSALLAEAVERWGRPRAIVADRFREADLRQSLEGAAFPPAALELRGMGYRDGAADVLAFRRAALDGKIKPRRSVLLRSAMSEARTIADPAGNEKISKMTQGGRRALARDDAAVAAVLAVAHGTRTPSAPSVRVTVIE